MNQENRKAEKESQSLNSLTFLSFFPDSIPFLSPDFLISRFTALSYFPSNRRRKRASENLPPSPCLTTIRLSDGMA